MTILWILASIYVTLCLLFYFLQDYFFFRPELLPSYFRFRYAFPFEEVNFEMEDGGTVNGVHFKVPNARGVVFYVKGNSRSVKGWGKFARDFIGKGYDFFMIDYRGFGKSRGKRTENIIYGDLQHVYRWLGEQYEEPRIILYGRSLGSGFAARIASWNKPRMLILDSPYFSFFHQINRYGFVLPIRWLLRYQIRTDRFIKKVQVPIFILHGRKDRLISYRQSEMLLKLAPEKIKLYAIEGAGHNNLPDFPQYHDLLYDILSGEAQHGLLEIQHHDNARNG